MQTRGVFISEFEREEFIRERWTYRPGDHVTFIAPSDYGKTTFGGRLLEVTATPKLPVFILAGKRKDDVMTDLIERNGWARSETYPPSLYARLFRKPSGYAIWPPFTGNEDVDDAVHAEVFRRCIRHRAYKGNCILWCDEFGELKELGLDKTTRAVHRRGRSNGVGQWGNLQGTSWNETHAYSQAQHLFLGSSPDEAQRKRFGEISGFDRKLIESIVMELPYHWWLYIRRRGRVMCIVRA